VLFCLFFLAAQTPAYTMENIFGSDDNDTLFGTSGIDEIFGGYGNDILTGNDGDDLLRGGYGDDILNGGNGNDVLRGGDGDDVLSGGPGIDRLYGGLGADRFVFDIDSMETDEVMDFNPNQNDTLWLQSNYPVNKLTPDDVRIDNEGDIEVQLVHENWSRIVRLHQNNLEFDVEEMTDGLQLHFTRRF
jgi:Ca2+-binding RTX toxin-like protein